MAAVAATAAAVRHVTLSCCRTTRNQRLHVWKDLGHAGRGYRKEAARPTQMCVWRTDVEEQKGGPSQADVQRRLCWVDVMKTISKSSFRSLVQALPFRKASSSDASSSAGLEADLFLLSHRKSIERKEQTKRSNSSPDTKFVRFGSVIPLPACSAASESSALCNQRRRPKRRPTNHG